MSLYVLTDGDDEPISDETYTDADRAIDARARLVAERDDEVTVAHAHLVESESDHPAANARVRIEDGQPVLEFESGHKILLRTFVKVAGADSYEERIDMAVETDAEPEGAWWDLFPDADGEDHPHVTIQPELIGSEGDS